MKNINFKKAIVFLLFLTTCHMLSPILCIAEEKPPAGAAVKDYYVKTSGYYAEPGSDPPDYVRNLSKTSLEQFRDITWLDVGLDFRVRYEYRENDYRPTVPATKYRAEPDNALLMRTRAYIGVRDILDPVRFAMEFQDSRSYNSLYETTNLDVNEFELIQAYVEFYFDNALGYNRPLSVRAGRMHFELLDKRLFSNNPFRNTTNNFDGFRIRFGKKQNNLDFDTFALQPVVRLKYEFDPSDEDTLIYGGVLSIRQWSEHITIQPYFLGRRQNSDTGNTVAANRKPYMDIYAPGLRVYGFLGRFDFDANINKQFGRFGVLSGTQQTLQKHDALGYSLELGYSFDYDMKPRFSLFYGYGTGDKNPNDNINQHFDIFYGFNQPWSRNDYFSWDNIHAPKVRLEFTPYKDVSIDTSYNAFWLESETDGWNRANIRDSTGKSGSFLGEEFNIRLKHNISRHINWSVSYARFMPGEFTKSQARADGPFTTEPTNFLYFEISFNVFGDGKP